MQDTFFKVVRSSGFAPVIEEALDKMNATYVAGEDLDIEDYLFSSFMTGPALDLYRMTRKLCTTILSKPNVQELDELEFESDFLIKLREFGQEKDGQGPSKAPMFDGTLVDSDPNKTMTIYKTPDRHPMSEDETLNLFRTVVK
jgi:hypothetical protein